ncbi:MAG: thioredoxin domain-containing protein [Steroidobacteraceae bacterium]|nr:thioredoxin domain-containing protein [Steroidobacteraceae bacterium]MBP7013746.1 thioredoxin domain-containing protein [Steroidobacteraceae bacterium]
MTSHSPTGARNSLATETSPYLRQHASNPVDWHPWGPEALDLARKLDKPILLSIGYSACHWCHVMAHESFEDPATAALMNELFVNIKVDREERPDLDRIYQTAHQVMNQAGGGWPLTMFLAPDSHRPFFSGTYFPPEQRYGMPGFRAVLEKVGDFYRSRRGDLKQYGDKLVDVLGQLQPPVDSSGDALSREPLLTARATLQREFDGSFGGFGEAPKFPHPANLELLLRTWRASAASEDPDLQALYMATLTLTRMAEGGLYDQLGGGFCRYSVDPYWMIPHFEKMLYDNAQLLGAYAQAAVATGEPLFRRVTAETAEWLLRDLRSPEGGFYSTLDADSEGHEGRFYVWTPDEVRGLLDVEQYEPFARRFGLDRDANFEGQWHLHTFKSIADIATDLRLDEATVETRIDEARARLLGVRNERVWPGRDEKILTSCNGMTIGGLARASRALERDDLAGAAVQAMHFLRARCWKDGRLLAVHTDGESRFPAYLDDYAMLAWGLLELLEARWDADALAWAVELVDVMLGHFTDHKAGGFYFTADDHESLILRPKTFSDDATPAGNGVAARVLIRLGYLLGETRYLDAAAATLRSAWAAIERYPHGHGTLLMALDEYTSPPSILVLRGDSDELDVWRSEVDKLYDPHRMIVAVPADARKLPAALASKRALGGAVAYVCRGMTCSPPVPTLAQLVRELRGQ